MAISVRAITTHMMVPYATFKETLSDQDAEP